MEKAERTKSRRGNELQLQIGFCPLYLLQLFHSSTLTLHHCQAVRDLRRSPWISFTYFTINYLYTHHNLWSNLLLANRDGVEASPAPQQRLLLSQIHEINDQNASRYLNNIPTHQTPPRWPKMERTPSPSSANLNQPGQFRIIIPINGQHGNHVHGPRTSRGPEE